MNEIDMAVSTKWRNEIEAKLKQIELEENIQILLAVESGSRAWGFHSPDSDYDVRFIYARPVDWHMRIDKTRDVVERPIDDELDLSGWELSKALTLALSSNAVVAEWLQSPIKYRENQNFLTEITNFCQRVLDRKSVSWHYLSLLKSQFSRCKDESGNLKLKPYFYTIRPALALRWMRLNNSAMPPMNMQELVAGSDLPVDVTTSLEELTEKKKALKEKGAMAFDPATLDEIIHSEVQFAEDWLSTAQTPKLSRSQWDEANAMNVKFSF